MAYLTEAQAAKKLQVSVGVVKNLVRSGRLKAIKLSGLFNTRIKEEDLYDIAPAAPVARKSTGAPVAALKAKAKKDKAKKEKAAPVKNGKPQGEPVLA